MSETLPAEKQRAQDGLVSALTLVPEITDETTGQRFVHKDYNEVVKPYAHEGHAPPASGFMHLGDAESLAAFVKRYGDPQNTFVKWNSAGIHATLNYHDPIAVGDLRQPWPADWVAFFAFKPTTEWLAWNKLADGQAKSHQEVVEFFENNVDDIDNPKDIAEIIRSLKGASNKSVTAAINRDGTTHVESSEDKSVDISIPPEILIAIPVLKGDFRTIDGPNGPVTGAVKQELSMFVRVSVADNGRLSFRFVIPGAERALESTYIRRVEQAREALGPDYPILRAAD